MLLIIILGMPQIYSIKFPSWLRVLGILILMLAAVVILLGILGLGQSFTLFPRPLPEGHLVTSGIYGVVRHPLYSAAIFATLGWALLTSNLLDIGMAAVVFLFVDLKSRREEEWLINAYPNYVDYRSRVKKLIPWIY